MHNCYNVVLVSCSLLLAANLTQILCTAFARVCRAVQKSKLSRTVTKSEADRRAMNVLSDFTPSLFPLQLFSVHRSVLCPARRQTAACTQPRTAIVYRPGWYTEVRIFVPPQPAQWPSCTCAPLGHVPLWIFACTVKANSHRHTKHHDTELTLFGRVWRAV